MIRTLKSYSSRSLRGQIIFLPLPCLDFSIRSSSPRTQYIPPRYSPCFFVDQVFIINDPFTTKNWNQSIFLLLLSSIAAVDSFFLSLSNLGGSSLVNLNFAHLMARSRTASSYALSSSCSVQHTKFFRL